MTKEDKQKEKTELTTKKELTAKEYFQPRRIELSPEMAELMSDVRAWKEYVRDKRGEEIDKKDRSGETDRLYKQRKKGILI